MSCTKEKQLVFSYIKNEHINYPFEEATSAKKRAIQLLIETVLENMEKRKETSEVTTYLH